MMKSHCILSIILLGSLSSFWGKGLMPGPATQKPTHDRFVPAPAQLLPHGAASWCWSPVPSCGFWAKLPSTTPVQCFPVCNWTITQWNGRCLAWCKDLDYSRCICGQKNRESHHVWPCFWVMIRMGKNIKWWEVGGAVLKLRNDNWQILIFHHWLQPRFPAWGPQTAVSTMKRSVAQVPPALLKASSVLVPS